MFYRVALQSLKHRKSSVFLTILAMTVSIFVLLGVEHIRHQAKASFSKTLSGVDLIVGARTGEINLLLYSVFRIGNATNNISWKNYQKITSHAKIAWSIPISLGDSHKGYRVMGTNQDYFTHFKYGKKSSLQFSQGNQFENLFDLVLGAEVAKKLNYQLGDQLVLAHGVAQTSFSLHKNHPFKVVGILAPTGTPVDQTLHVSLEGIEAIHINWSAGGQKSTKKITNEQLAKHDLTPKNITAFMLGLKSKISTFQIQRQINNYKQEPLLAILPGVTLTQLWQMVGSLETTLRLVSILILIASLLGLSAMLLASMRERQKEIAVMRTIGARPLFIFSLIQAEALLMTLIGIIAAIILLTIALLVGQDFIAENYGLYINTNFINQQSIIMLLAILGGTIFIATLPAISAYRKSLNLGLNT